MAEWQHKYKESEWVGKRYGYLTITGYDRKEREFICRCDCGTIGKLVKPSFLFNGKVQTCGRECAIHNGKYDGRSKNRTYRIWVGMIARCYNEKNVSYKSYGKRGISVCDEWRNDYWSFHKWSLENGYADDLTIDRIDSDGNYEPSNCRWATYQQQRDNERDPYTLVNRPKFKTGKTIKQYEVRGVWRSKPEWCSIYGVSEPFVTYRMKKGMTMQEALETPKGIGRPMGT